MFPTGLRGSTDLAVALEGMQPVDVRKIPCLPEEASCEYWIAQRGEIAERIMCLSREVEEIVVSKVVRRNPALALKCLRELYDWITDHCDRNKPFCASIPGPRHVC